MGLVHTMSQLIERNDVSYVDEWIEQLHQQGLINGPVHTRGLFRLLQKLEYCIDYTIYNIELEPATEADYIEKEKLLFIKNEKHTEVSDRIRMIRNLPALHGMVNFLDVIALNNWLKGDDILLYQSLIINDKSAKVFLEEKGEQNMWYLYEGRSNVLLNALGKVVNIADKVETDILAVTIHSDISKRSLPKRTPNVDIINKYLKNSTYIQIEGEYAKINVDQRNLTEIELDIYDYFKKENKEAATFPELNSYLTRKGYQEAYRKQKLYHCPFLYVDKSQGRGNYKIQLIHQFSPVQENENSYEAYRNKLIVLHGKTDVTREEKQRTEQFLLRNWLFKNKETEECAICGRTFSCRSLVTAHKKKRSSCTEEERTDPYIVMPVCVFGCDYLYENHYIEIHSGQISILNIENLQTAEKYYLKGLEHRVVDPRWLHGSENYFINKKQKAGSTT